MRRLEVLDFVVALPLRPALLIDEDTALLRSVSHPKDRGVGEHEGTWRALRAKIQPRFQAEIAHGAWNYAHANGALFVSHEGARKRALHKGKSRRAAELEHKGRRPLHLRDDGELERDGLTRLGRAGGVDQQKRRALKAGEPCPRRKRIHQDGCTKNYARKSLGFHAPSSCRTFDAARTVHHTSSASTFNQIESKAHP